MILSTKALVVALERQTAIVKWGLVVIVLVVIWLLHDELSGLVSDKRTEVERQHQYLQRIIDVSSDTSLKERNQTVNSWLADSQQYLFTAQTEAKAKASVDSWVRRNVLQSRLVQRRYTSSILDEGDYWLVVAELNISGSADASLNFVKMIDSYPKRINFRRFRLNDKSMTTTMVVPVWK